MRKMKWTYEQYCETPSWIIDGIFASFQGEAEADNKTSAEISNARRRIKG